MTVVSLRAYAGEVGWWEALRFQARVVACALVGHRWEAQSVTFDHGPGLYEVQAWYECSRCEAHSHDDPRPTG